MRAVLSYVLARFSEPSSYAGLAAILATLGLHLSSTTVGIIAQVLAALCAIAAIVLKETAGGVPIAKAIDDALGQALNTPAPPMVVAEQPATRTTP